MSPFWYRSPRQQHLRRPEPSNSNSHHAYCITFVVQATNAAAGSAQKRCILAAFELRWGVPRPVKLLMALRLQCRQSATHVSSGLGYQWPQA
jgi:hypothetical protein